MNHGVGPEGYFEKHYLSRDWHFYRGNLAVIVQNAEPGPILDLGAGVGYLVEACHRWGLKCIGLEGSKRAVEIALARFPEMEIREFLLSNPLPFEEDSFGVVVMNQVIEHLEPSVADNCVQESFRVLRPGGVLVIYSPSKHNTSQRLDDPTHINMYLPKELKEFLESKGFQGIVPHDSPLPLLGKTRIGRFVMQCLFRATRLDRLSATANCVAYKPRKSTCEAGLAGNT